MPLDHETRKLLKQFLSERNKKSLLRDSRGHVVATGVVMSKTPLRKKRRETAIKDPKHPDFLHGLTGYNKYGCRCEICTEAKAENNRQKFFKPCINECGNYAWHSPGNSGRCFDCSIKERSNGTNKT